MINQRIKYKPFTQLEFDKDNPRLPHSVVDSNDEKDVIDWMLKDASIIELMGSIGEKGFFAVEPLLAVKDPKTDSYIVVEGNRRLTAVKLLHNPELATRKTNAIKQISDKAKFKPVELPVLIADERKDVLDYLGFRHITGVKTWSSLAKAKYLKELQEQYDNSALPIAEQYKELAKSIGSRSDYVKDLLIGLDVYENIHDHGYFDIRGLNEETIDFGVYYNALKYSNISKFLGIDKTKANPTESLEDKKLEEFTRWVSEGDQQNRTMLGESRNLSKLNAVVLEPKALSMLRSGRSLDDAVLYTEEPYELYRKAVNESLNSLSEAQRNFHQVLEVEESDLNTLKELNSIAGNLQYLVEYKLSTSKKVKA